MNDGNLTLNSVCYFLLISWVMNSSVESQIFYWKMSVRVSDFIIISIDKFPNVTQNHHQLSFFENITDGVLLSLSFMSEGVARVRLNVHFPLADPDGGVTGACTSYGSELSSFYFTCLFPQKSPCRT